MTGQFILKDEHSKLKNYAAPSKPVAYVAPDNIVKAVQNRLVLEPQLKNDDKCTPYKSCKSKIDS